MFHYVTLDYLQFVQQILVLVAIESWHGGNQAECFTQPEMQNLLQYYYVLYDSYMDRAKIHAYVEAKTWILDQAKVCLLADTVSKWWMHPFQTYDEYLDESMNREIDYHAMTPFEYHKAMQDWTEKTKTQKFRHEYERGEQHKVLFNYIVFRCLSVSSVRANDAKTNALEYVDAVPYYHYVSHMCSSLEKDSSISPKGHLEKKALREIRRFLSG